MPDKCGEDMTAYEKRVQNAKRVQIIERQLNEMFGVIKVIRIIQYESETLEDALWLAGNPIVEEDDLLLIRKIMKCPRAKGNNDGATAR